MLTNYLVKIFILHPQIPHSRANLLVTNDNQFLNLVKEVKLFVCMSVCMLDQILFLLKRPNLIKQTSCYSLRRYPIIFSLVL